MCLARIWMNLPSYPVVEVTFTASTFNDPKQKDKLLPHFGFTSLHW